MLHLLLKIFRCQLEIVFAISYFHFDSMIDGVFWMPTSLTSRDIIFRTFCSFYKFRAYTAIYLICQTYSLFSSFSSFFVCMRRVDVATSQPPVSFGGKYSYTVADCVIPQGMVCFMQGFFSLPSFSQSLCIQTHINT